MHNSRLIEVFATFTKKEIRDLSKFVKSPFFNQREDVVQMFNYLADLLPFNNSEKLSKEVAFRSIYPGEAYDEKKIGYCMSFLYKTINSFLTISEFQEDPVNTNVYLSRSLVKRGLNRQFEKAIKEAISLLDQNPHRDKKYHFNKYQIFYEKYDYSKKIKRSTTEGFKELSEEMNTFFISNKLVHFCIAISNKMVSTDELQYDLLEETLNIVETKGYLEVPAVALYYYSFKALTEPDATEYFDKLRELLKEHNTKFPKRELNDIYLMTVNYCIRQCNLGKTEYYRELFEIYKEGLDLGIFINNGNLSRFTYTNVAMAGLKLKEFEWVEKFIYDFKATIEKKHRENIFLYNLALFYYAKPDYPKAMELLQKTEFDDLFNNLNARTMLLKMFFEMDEIDPLNSLMDSFKNFIYRHKDLTYHRDMLLNLIKFTKQLLKVNSFEKKANIKLREKIIETKYVAERKWLLEQIDKIEGK